MGKNQHVTPKGDKWQVKGAGNTKATKLSIRKHKQKPTPEKLQRINTQNLLLTDETAKFVQKTVMETILARLKTPSVNLHPQN